MPAESHLGGVRGVDNVIALTGEETGELVQLGKGSGQLPVATALLNDLIGLFHPSHSWTGRFPAAGFAPAAPEFDRFLVHEQHVRVAGEPSPGSIPLLESMRTR